jgi:hypothetical protein
MKRACLLCQCKFKVNRLSGSPQRYCNGHCRDSAAKKRYRKKYPQAQVLIDKKYRASHPERFRAAARLADMRRRMRVLDIIGWCCVDCKNPNKIPQIAHLDENPKHYWSGPAHRARKGRAGVVRDLLKIHKDGKDIRLLVVPLCRSCNMTRRWTWEKSQNGRLPEERRK